MALRPAATKRSSSLNEVASPAVQPSTLPPNISGAISIPELPSLRFSIPSLPPVRYCPPKPARDRIRAATMRRTGGRIKPGVGEPIAQRVRSQPQAAGPLDERPVQRDVRIEDLGNRAAGLGSPSDRLELLAADA